MKCATGILSAIALGVLAGCVAVVFAAGAAAGVGGAVWYHGQLRTTLAGSVPSVRAAAVATLQKMSNGVPAQEGDSMEATARSYTADGREITVELKSLSPSVTEIHIEIGFWGDYDLSQQILEDIANRLPKTSGMAQPEPATSAAS
jgi:hypothetical protein